MWEYYYPDYLYHHGTKGMKWGRRLYQNKDGSLTPLGKVRYRTNKDFKGQIDKERALAKARAARAAKKSVEEKRAELLKSVDPKEIYANKHLLTTQELNDRINRIDTEARLQGKIVTEQQKTGMDYVNSKMKTGKETLDNAVNLFKSVDSAYSTVTSSSLGKVLAKKLGLEPPRKEFDLEDFVNNINKKTTQEIQDVAKRVTNEKIIRDRMDALKPKDGTKTGSDDSNDSSSTTSSSNNKTNDSASSTSDNDKYEATGKDVIGKGTSKFTGWDDGPVVDAVYNGESYVSTLLQLEDKSK